MSNTFEQYQRALMPAGMAGPYGLAWAAAQGATKDGLALDAKEAVKARFVDLAPPDALPRLGSDRGIARAPGEGADSWRDRIAGAWESWSWVGTRYGIGYAVGLLGLGTPALWSWRDLPWDADASRWARIRVAFTGRATWGAFAWGSALWGSRLVQPIESTSAATVRAMLTPILRQWINARDRVESVSIHRGNAIWGRFLWGAHPYASAASTVLGPPAWGAARWSGFAWGVFC